MTHHTLPSPSLNIPRIRQNRDGAIVITSWGEIEGQILRAGDHLLLGAAEVGRLLLLVPRGHGRPMLGRRNGTQLFAEPSGVRASETRWQVAGGVSSVERRLERGGAFGGRWHVTPRVVPLQASTPAALRAARELFVGGWMEGHALGPFFLRAAVTPERLGVGLAVGLAATPERSEALAVEARNGWLRFDVLSSGGQVIAGPWSAQEEEQRQVMLFDSPQTKLFG